MITKIPIWMLYGIVPMSIVIGIFDYLMFNRWAKCDKCGYQNNLWYHWILPTFIELALFYVGILIGIKIK